MLGQVPELVELQKPAPLPKTSVTATVSLYGISLYVLPAVKLNPGPVCVLGKGCSSKLYCQRSQSNTVG